ncbi:Uncharacterized protein ACO02O_02427 [Dirofilaria immitis]
MMVLHTKLSHPLICLWHSLRRFDEECSSNNPISLALVQFIECYAFFRRNQNNTYGREKSCECITAAVVAVHYYCTGLRCCFLEIGSLQFQLVDVRSERLRLVFIPDAIRIRSTFFCKLYKLNRL